MVGERSYLAFFPGKADLVLTGLDAMLIHRRMGYRIIDLPEKVEAEEPVPSASPLPSPGPAQSKAVASDLRKRTRRH